MIIDSAANLYVGLKAPAVMTSTHKVAGEGFGSALTNALLEVSNTQKASGALTKAFTLESSTVSLEEVMLAGVKSNIGFQTTLQARNRLVQAYSEIMNMPI